jgi:hypothetical protein
MTKQQEQPPTIGATIRACFKLSSDAAILRDLFGKYLQTAAPGRTSAIISRMYHTLNDMTRALDQAEATLAESHTLGRYLKEKEAQCL